MSFNDNKFLNSILEEEKGKEENKISSIKEDYMIGNTSSDRILNIPFSATQQFIDFVNSFSDDFGNKIIESMMKLTEEERNKLMILLLQLDSKGIEDLKAKVTSILGSAAGSENTNSGNFSGNFGDYAVYTPVNLNSGQPDQPEPAAAPSTNTANYNDPAAMTVIPSFSAVESEVTSPSGDDTPGLRLIPSLSFSDKQFKETPALGVGAVEEIFLMSAPTDIKWDNFSFNAWENYIHQYGGPRGINEREFYDFNFSFPKPNLDKEDLMNKDFPSYWIADVSPEYNYYEEEYESLIFDSKVHENTLPNLYVFSYYERERLEQLKNAKSMINPRYLQLMTFDGVIGSKNLVIEPKGQYLDKYVAAYTNILKSRVERGEEKINNIRKGYKNIIIPPEEVEYANSLEDRKRLFPMSMNIKFSTDLKSAFSEMLKQTKLVYPFTTEVMKNVISDGFKERVTMNATEPVLTRRGRDKAVVTNLQSLNLIDLSDWLNDFMALSDNASLVGGINPFVNNNYNLATPLGKYSAESVSSSDNDYILHKKLLLLAFMGKLKDYIKNNRRTFKDIAFGKPAYSETLLYRVSKYYGKGINKSNLVQSYYILNDVGAEVFNLFDTQVKFDQYYTYEITAYVLLVGTKVTYLESHFKEDTSDKAIVSVRTTPVLKIAEVPFYEETAKIFDFPPMPPNVQMYCYKNINNKVLVTVGPGIGEMITDFIQIQSEDSDIFDKMKKSQKTYLSEIAGIKEMGKDPIAFRFDDRPARFEVFRMETKPVSKRDFNGHKIKTLVVDKKKGKVVSGESTFSAFLDEISPNKKYYYMFRTVDVHGNLSNPTDVFQVLITESKEEGILYSDISVIEIDDSPDENKNKQESFKVFRKSVKIIPALQQVVVDEEKIINDGIKSGAEVKEAKLGIQEQSVWGKQFKMRITSKKSGKKMDIFFKFENSFSNLAFEEEEK